MRAFVVVIDGLGVGRAPDAAAFGDAGADTLRHAADAVGGIRLPVLESLGLGNAARAAGLRPCARPGAVAGRLTERSAATDSATGHRELMGLVTATAPPTYPDGFPDQVMAAVDAAMGGRGWLCNAPASGTEVIERLGEEHLSTGAPIVYTSADSVLQIAAHEDVLPPAGLYAACERVRAVMTGQHAVERVIARPFTGAPGAFRRTAGRRDFALPPPGPTALDALAGAGVPVVGVGKIGQLVAGRGLSEDHPTGGDAEGVRLVAELMGSLPRGLVLANLLDLDTRFGHRRDAAGYGRALEALDGMLGRLVAAARPGDLLIVTADHGNDPAQAGTDHTREQVPLLARVAGAEHPSAVHEGDFADVGATALAWLRARAPAGLAGRPVALPSPPGT